MSARPADPSGADGGEIVGQKEACALLDMTMTELRRLVARDGLPGAYEVDGRVYVPRAAIGGFLHAPAPTCRGRSRHGLRCGRTAGANGWCGRCYRPDSEPATPPPTTRLPLPGASPAAGLATEHPPDSVVSPELRQLYDLSYSLVREGADVMDDETDDEPTLGWFEEMIGGNLDADLRDEAVRLAQDSRASTTRQTYMSAFGGFQRFCDDFGQRALPATPQAVGLYLTWLAVHGKVDRNGNETGEKLSVARIRTILHAIAYEHARVGAASPTDDKQLRMMVAGYARRYGRPPVRAHALRLEQLGAVAMKLMIPPEDVVRDRTLCLVATDPQLQIGASQLANLDWGEVTFDEDPAGPTYLQVARDRIVVLHRKADRRICAAEALREWAIFGASGRVFTTARNAAHEPRPMTRQNVRKRVDTWLGRAELSGRLMFGLPRLSPSEQLQLVQLMGGPTSQQRRDLAIMMMLWWLQLRRSELAALDWGDLTFHPAYLIARINRSKTDPYGEGEARSVFAQDDRSVCPVQAMVDWKAELEALLGRPVEQTDPVLLQLHTGVPTGRLSGEAVGETFKRCCEAADVEPEPGHKGHKIASHGGRAGGTTEMLRRGVQAEVIAEFSRRKSTASVLTYWRPGMLHGNPTEGLSAPTDLTTRAPHVPADVPNPQPRSPVDGPTPHD